MLAEVSSNKKHVEVVKNEWHTLWTDLKRGDPDSLSRLFENSYAQLFNYGYKMAPDKVLIEDAIQELFLRLWERRAVIGEAESVKAYLFASLRRIIFRRLDQSKRRMERNHRYQNEMVEPVYNVEELMIHFDANREKRNSGQRALQSLSERQREAIYLKYYDGLSSAEIARVMDINIQSVYNHVSEAIQEMQEFVDDSH
jgi:RNA polymerase sigma factor (sigma-70 family)